MARYSSRNNLCSFYISLIVGVAIWLAKDSNMSTGAKVREGRGACQAVQCLHLVSESSRAQHWRRCLFVSFCSV